VFKVESCPHCGSKAELIKCRVYCADAWRVACTACGITTPRIMINHPFVTGKGLDESTRYSSEQAAAIAVAKWNSKAVGKTPK